MRLSTIQKRENLNVIYREDEQGPGGGYHDYMIVDAHSHEIFGDIKFQKGPRKDHSSRHGVTNEDLLEIVRDRLQAFCAGNLPSRETTMALMHVEEALLWMAKRTEDRIERNVLGTMEK